MATARPQDEVQPPSPDHTTPITAPSAIPPPPPPEDIGRRDGIDGGTGDWYPAVVGGSIPLPEPRVVLATDAGDQVVAEAGGDPFFLGFVAGPHYPPTGERIDPALLALLDRPRSPSRPHDDVYVFLMFQKRITVERVEELQALGARIFGFHPHYALRAALPVTSVGDAARHPAIRWVGLAQPWQKVHPALEPWLQTAAPGDVHAVYVSLFESDFGSASTWEPVGDGMVQEVTPGGASVARVLLDPPSKKWMSHGWQQRVLQERGLVIDEYVPEIAAFRARMRTDQLATLLALDFVQFVEPDLPDTPNHDESTPLILADATRATYPGNTNSVAISGEIDSGIETAHLGMNHFFGAGFNTIGATTAWDDPCGHGTHVGGTILGLPTSANQGYTGMAPRLGFANTARVRNVRIFPGTTWNSCGTAGSSHASRYSPMRGNYTDGSGNVSPPPHVINCSWGSFSGTTWTGTEANARTLDAEVWDQQQMYVFSAGNDGSGTGTIGLPAVAKNAFTVGNVMDYRNSTVGDPGTLWTSSSRGPCADNRWKPNVSAPGRWIRSARSDTSNGYVDFSGTSMAAPHVAGLVAQLADHYSFMRYVPHRTASLLMATATTRNNASLTTPSSSHLDQYGAGKVSAMRAHYADADYTWTNWGFTESGPTWNHHFADFTVNAGATRLVVCMAYHEDSSSSGASQALVHDMDLWIDAPPTLSSTGNSGEYFAQQSSVDNTEIRYITNPTAGTWRWKVWPESTTFFGSVRVGVTVHIIYGDTSPTMTLSLNASDPYVQPSEQVDVTATVSPSDHIAANVFLDSSVTSSGRTLHASGTTLLDGVTTDFLTNQHSGFDVVLGDVEDDGPRSTQWTYSWSTEGNKTVSVEARSDNATNTSQSVVVTVDGTAPGLATNLRSTSHTPNVWSNDPNLDYAWTSATDNLSGVDGYGLFTSTSPTGAPSNVRDIGAVTSYSETLSSSGAGWYFKMKTVDRSGNWTASFASTGPYLIDTIAPGTVSNLTSTSHQLNQWSNDSTVDFGWTAATDSHSGVDGYGESFGNAPGVFVSQVRDMGAVTSFTRAMPNGASLYFALRTVDRAGNWGGGTAEVGPYRIDTARPNGPTNLAANLSTTAWNANGNLTVTWTAATDALSGLAGYDVRVDNNPSTTLAGILDLNAAATAYSTVLGSSSASWWFHIAPRDVAGNYAPTQHLGPFRVDTSGPGLRLTIDAGAATTTSTGVVLDINASDPQSGVTHMRFRNDGGAWSAWETYAGSKNWNLTSNGGSSATGTRTVRCEVRNGAGTSTGGNDAIYYYRPVSYFGTACAGSLGIPTFQVVGIPGIGRSVTFRPGNTAALSMALFLGVSNTTWAGVGLPLDLGIVGSPGCFLGVSPDVVFYSGPVLNIPAAIPNDPAIVGATLYFQPHLYGDPSGRLVVTTRSAAVFFNGA